MEKKVIVCEPCGGRGWFPDHDRNDTRPEHYNDGDCQSCPVQVRCEECGGSGEILITPTT